MPQWRKLWTKTTESLDVNDMPDDFTRLLWVLLPLALDREGRILDSVALIRSRTMPLRDDVSSDMIAAAIEWYVSREMLVRYAVDGRTYLCVPAGRWKRYQGDTSREADSNHPGPEDGEVVTNSRPAHDQITTDSRTDQDTDIDTDTDQEEREIGAANAATPPHKPKRPENSPAVKAHWRILHCRLKQSVKDQIDQHVSNGQLEQWERVLEAWALRGFNPKNVRGQLDWLRDGIPASGPRASPGRKSNVETSMDAVNSFLAKEAERGET